ncbi:MAG: cysteine desulfurase [Planctomycetes bacterium]|nr:cysteine desulfurase [Planctomycetota bacterium]
MPEPIYLDHNATTPLLPEVAEAMRARWAEPVLNPASQHEFGRAARRVLEDARDRIAEILGAKTVGPDADRVLFTSGGTESNNLAIQGLLQRAGARAPSAADGRPPSGAEDRQARHLIISAVEHPSIATLADELHRRGHAIDQLGVDPHGVICVADLANLLRPNTALVAAMLGQNETGVLQPVAELAAICAKHSIPLHTDAAQVVGKLPVNFRALGAATMTIAAHKFHGPLGIGALIVRHGVDLQPQLFGGFQQAGLRPGTEPVALAVGMCRALELWHAEQHERAARMRELRDRFERMILAGWPAAVIIGVLADRLPHTSNIAFVGLDRQMLFMALDQAGIACSTGSACASGSSETSPVLIAMGCEEAVLGSALRFSLGATTTAAHIDEAARRILHCCNALRQQKQR